VAFKGKKLVPAERAGDPKLLWFTVAGKGGRTGVEGLDQINDGRGIDV